MRNTRDVNDFVRFLYTQETSAGRVENVFVKIFHILVWQWVIEWITIFLYKNGWGLNTWTTCSPRQEFWGIAQGFISPTGHTFVPVQCPLLIQFKYQFIWFMLSSSLSVVCYSDLRLNKVIILSSMTVVQIPCPCFHGTVAVKLPLS